MEDNFGLELFNEGGDLIFTSKEEEGFILVVDVITTTLASTGSKSYPFVKGADVSRLRAMPRLRSYGLDFNKVTISGNTVSWTPAEEPSSKKIDLVVTLS